MNKIIGTILLCFLLLSACADAPDFDSAPYIEFERMESNQIAQSSQKDTVYFVLYFEDGDGNLRPGDQGANVFLMDLRDSTIAFSFASPDIPREGSGNGVKGTLRLQAHILKGDVCCLYETGQPPCTPSSPTRTDSLYYDLYLYDEAGNRSNTVKAGPIILLCD